jgi:hypothetical protein
MPIKVIVKLAVLFSIILFIYCSRNPISKGGTDTGNGMAAIYYANGAPAPGVTVKAFDVNDTSRVPLNKP